MTSMRSALPALLLTYFTCWALMLPGYALYRHLNDVSATANTSDMLEEGDLRLQGYKATNVGTV